MKLKKKTLGKSIFQLQNMCLNLMYLCQSSNKIGDPMKKLNVERCNFGHILGLRFTLNYYIDLSRGTHSRPLYESHTFA